MIRERKMTMDMLALYARLSEWLEPSLRSLLMRRVKNGKEDIERINERYGIASRARPDGPLVWLHAASVGEAQSAQILIDRLTKAVPGLNILVTTGTVTSARTMSHALPANAFHQFLPLDHPAWVKRFIGHWEPDLALWMESELWPNMLLALGAREVPAILVNARLSNKSYGRWRFFKGSARKILSVFDTVLTQTEKDKERFTALGAANVTCTGNIKYSARPLGYNEMDFRDLSTYIGNRPAWLYASTHKGEEEMAARIHERLAGALPGLLTIIVPRHPNRRDEIRESLKNISAEVLFRGEHKKIPKENTGIYIADTMGELGLFYRLAPVACIGRSFSDDGGGGHNPIEAAQLHSVILYGPRVQYQQEIFDEMESCEAAVQVKSESKLAQKLHTFLTNPQARDKALKAAASFLQEKDKIIDVVMDKILPLLEKVREDARLNPGKSQGM